MAKLAYLVKYSEEKLWIKAKRTAARSDPHQTSRQIILVLGIYLYININIARIYGKTRMRLMTISRICPWGSPAIGRKSRTRVSATDMKNRRLVAIARNKSLGFLI